MKNFISIAIATVMLVSCAKNEINLVNSGTIDWQQIEIKAGGCQLKIDCLEGGESKRFRFKSKKESGGLIVGNLNGKAITREFGYFTPNLSANFEIILDDDEGIEIKEY